MGMANSGKSTIIKILSGREKVDDGKIFVDGVVDYNKLKDSCEVVNDFKTRKLLENDSVYKNLVFYGRKFNTSKHYLGSASSTTSAQSITYTDIYNNYLVPIKNGSTTINITKAPTWAFEEKGRVHRGDENDNL